jgi:hypothetical protein
MDSINGWRLAIGSPTPLSGPKILDKACQVTSSAGTKSAVEMRKIRHSVPYVLTSLTLRQSGRSNSPPQHVIPQKRHRYHGVFKKKKIGVVCSDAMTFCHWQVSVPGESVAWDATRTS